MLLAMFFYLPYSSNLKYYNGIGNIFNEDKAEYKMLVFGGIHVGAQRVRGSPERFFDVVDHGSFCCL